MELFKQLIYLGFFLQFILLMIAAAFLTVQAITPSDSLMDVSIVRGSDFQKQSSSPPGVDSPSSQSENQIIEEPSVSKEPEEIPEPINEPKAEPDPLSIAQLPQIDQRSSHPQAQKGKEGGTQSRPGTGDDGDGLTGNQEGTGNVSGNRTSAPSSRYGIVGEKGENNQIRALWGYDLPKDIIEYYLRDDYEGTDEERFQKFLQSFFTMRDNNVFLVNIPGPATGGFIGDMASGTAYVEVVLPNTRNIRNVPPEGIKPEKITIKHVEANPPKYEKLMRESAQYSVQNSTWYPPKKNGIPQPAVFTIKVLYNLFDGQDPVNPDSR